MSLLRFLAVVMGTIGVVGCTTAPVIYPEHPLVDQILKVRAGHDGKLTNRTVPAPDAQGLVVPIIKDYPLDDPEFRKTVNELGFICNIGGKRFKICTDKPGFCRFSHAKKCFLGLLCRDGELLEEYLPVEKYGFLLDANARCAKREKYDLWASQ